MKDEQRLGIIKEIADNKEIKFVVCFTKFPEVGDEFTVGDVTFISKKKEYKITVK